MPTTVLCFAAADVAAETVEYTAQCVVLMVAFGRGDPEKDGHVWSFSRALRDDWGVCTVREIQRATFYEGIVSFHLHRLGLECVFEPKAAAELGCSGLHITFQISDEAWGQLAATALTIFQDRAYFHCDA